jgi:hypothetical protein
MSDHLNDYCTWMCTGIFEKSETLIESSGTPYRLVRIGTHMGTIIMFVGNHTLFDLIDGLETGQRVEAKGFLSEKNQSNGGNSPYFLRSSEMRVL